jgi:hypothetical protein
MIPVLVPIKVKKPWDVSPGPVKIKNPGWY